MRSRPPPVAVIVFETFWSKTVRRTKKQEATEKSSVCLSASEFAELPSPPIFRVARKSCLKYSYAAVYTEALSP